MHEETPLQTAPEHSLSAPTTGELSSAALQPAREVLQKYWGYHAFRPLQEQAILEVLEGRDSLLVLPTGGGKSLCYQVPALLREGLTVVVSPLIALMKDQVDALRDLGIAAAAVNSSQSAAEQRQIADEIQSGQIKLLYVAPERLCTERMLNFLTQQQVASIAVDEAHCISSWGHQFRPEYRLLGKLRERLPNVDLHAFTATATEQVRQDIARQLGLQNPQILVGNFDRPNLMYRVTRRGEIRQQIREVLDRHPGQSGIIYCISRKQVEELEAHLQGAGVTAVAYHAGLEHDKRQRAQDDFLNEKAQIVVATVAFGMGIDKPNVRFVIHASATKSIENYQQEAGRAGRDGLPAECVLFYSGQDFSTWKRLQSDLTGDAAEVATTQLRLKSLFCQTPRCRHRALVEHFGQAYAKENCGACDVCLAEIDEVPDAIIIAQKILSCVVRVEQRFGGEYVANVLVGSQDQRILGNGHQQLSTYGLLKEHPKQVIRDWIDQLEAQNCLEREPQYGTLLLTPTGRSVFKQQFKPRLQMNRARKQAAVSVRDTLSETEQQVFEKLRQLRREIAAEKSVAPFVVFGDVTLRDLACRRPISSSGFLQIQGVGRHKCEEYGPRFLPLLEEICDQLELTSDVGLTNSAESAK